LTWRASLLIAVRYLFGSTRQRRLRAQEGRNPSAGDDAAAPNAIPVQPRRRSRIRGAVIGIAVSLVPLIVVLEVADGMIQGITARFIEVGTYHLQAIATGDPDVQSVSRLVRVIRTLPGVTAAYPERQGLGLITSRGGKTGGTIRAIDPSMYEKDPTFREYIHMVAGRFDLSTGSSMVIGTGIAHSLDLAPGDTVRVITVRSFGQDAFLPRVSTFTVSGIFTSGYQELDKLWVFIPFDRGARILPSDTARQIIGIKVADPFAIPNPLFKPQSRAESLNVLHMIGSLQQLLGDQWRLYSWYDLQRAQYMSFATTKNLLVLIMILIVAVAAINISSSVIMLVLEKQGEIAILKSIGASPAGIRRIFILAGFSAGTLGTIIGIGIGLFVAVNVNEAISALQWVLNIFLELFHLLISPFLRVPTVRVDIFNPEFYLQTIPIRIRASEVFLAAFLSIMLSTAASYLPALRAGNIRPLSIMRKH